MWSFIDWRRRRVCLLPNPHTSTHETLGVTHELQSDEDRNNSQINSIIPIFPSNLYRSNKRNNSRMNNYVRNTNNLIEKRFNIYPWSGSIYIQRSYILSKPHVLNYLVVPKYFICSITMACFNRTICTNMALTRKGLHSH